MKKIIRYTLALIFCVSLFVCQSNRQTPKVVKEAFKSKYPGENDPDWTKDKNENYEASFKKDGDHFRADFDSEGNWIETEQSIKKKKLPIVIEAKLAVSYDDYEIVEIEKVDHHSKGAFYDVELKKDGEKIDVEFKANGTVIN